MISRVTNYRVQVEGNLVLPELATRARFDGNLRLSTNQVWQELHLRLTLRPTTWEIHSVAAERTVRFRMGEDEQVFERVFKFSELQNPAGLLQLLGAPWMAAVMSEMGLKGSSNAGLNVTLKWEARHDVIKIGHASVRAFRLQTRFLDKYQVVIFISRVGEILRVELPDEILLVNDQLANL
jgi:hypothetical protein